MNLNLSEAGDKFAKRQAEQKKHLADNIDKEMVDPKIHILNHVERMFPGYGLPLLDIASFRQRDFQELAHQIMTKYYDFVQMGKFNMKVRDKSTEETQESILYAVGFYGIFGRENQGETYTRFQKFLQKNNIDQDIMLKRGHVEMIMEEGYSPEKIAKSYVVGYSAGMLKFTPYYELQEFLLNTKNQGGEFTQEEFMGFMTILKACIANIVEFNSKPVIENNKILMQKYLVSLKKANANTK